MRDHSDLGHELNTVVIVVDSTSLERECTLRVRENAE